MSVRVSVRLSTHLRPSALGGIRVGHGRCLRWRCLKFGAEPRRDMLSLFPRGERIGKRALARGALLDGEGSSMTVIVDDRNVEP
jgi:hypothetical protein